jgi:Uma2 family endonuclease
MKRDRDAAEPAWDVALLFPDQGAWSEGEYLALDSNRLVEFSSGRIEVLPLPTTSHQLIVFYLCRLLDSYATARKLGMALLALRVRLWRGKFREPDVVFLLASHLSKAGEKFWSGADLVMEVISGTEEDRRRNLVDKRLEYARARIAEYWIVDPEEEQIVVLRLVGKEYVVHGDFRKGDVARSHLLPGFTVDVSAILAQQVAAARASVRARKKPR